MPYANQTPFARQMRAYLQDRRRRLPEATVDQYERWLLQAGRSLNWKDPKNITVKDLESLEAEYMGLYSESTVTEKLSMLRDMLKQAGNKDANRYKMLCSMQPAADSVYLTEEQIAICRQVARGRGNRVELIFSLHVDNGLRPVDIMRLTMSNARELLDCGESMILGKGRKGGKLGKLVLSPMTRKPLMIYLMERRKLPTSTQYDQLMLRCYQGRVSPVSRHHLYSVVKSVMMTAKIEAKPRDLRKTCGNRVYKLTRDVAMSAMILRHSNPGTTFKHYIGADSVEMKDVQARLATMNPEGPSQQSDST